MMSPADVEQLANELHFEIFLQNLQVNYLQMFAEIPAA